MKKILYSSPDSCLNMKIKLYKYARNNNKTFTLKHAGLIGEKYSVHVVEKISMLFTSDVSPVKSTLAASLDSCQLQSSIKKQLPIEK